MEGCGAEVGAQPSSEFSASQLRNEVRATQLDMVGAPLCLSYVPSSFPCNLPSLAWAVGRENGCLWIDGTRKRRPSPPRALWGGSQASQLAAFGGGVTGPSAGMLAVVPSDGMVGSSLRWRWRAFCPGISGKAASWRGATDQKETEEASRV